ncbi:hypothetical protein Zm00014a_040949 [Zea mays]|uniref:Uncharacterized protein n=1 Tax=Zea mays TaxID=4577 RepID=A0A3L6E9N1_MAIZE|nr:hypothetical protein Zm00014a_040949 [Zea mays]
MLTLELVLRLNQMPKL